MKHKVNVILVAGLWLALTAAAWLLPPGAFSLSERRPLEQFPAITVSSLTSGRFMADFEDYALDQFPLRDSFRTVKALFHTHILGQRDNNGIYLAEGMAAKQEYPLKEASLTRAAERFTLLYDKYLEGSNIWFAVVPNKGTYLAEDSGHLTLDLPQMQRFFREALPWAEHIDLTQALSAGDYYRTDTHWRQENLLKAAGVLCQALEIPVPRQEDYTLTSLERPFYGVYYGQAALPMEPETMYLLESELLRDCRVYDYETGQYADVYDRKKLDSRDLYDVFLSGSRSLLTIENPHGEPGRELILFRDSFGSAIAPLLVQGYSRITLVDIRYIQIPMLSRHLDFHGQDVLFLYSTLVLNNSETIQ